jgi:hypothetical protein
MPKRTILFTYYTEKDGTIHERGDEVDLSADEAKRGDELGAFVESEDARESSLVGIAGESRMGGVHTKAGAAPPERKSDKSDKATDKAKDK